jgi:hypothetical protein
MRAFSKPLPGLALVLLTLVGCQRLNVDKKISLAPNEVQDIIIDAPKSQQQVKVVVNSSASPVDVYVVLEEAQNAVKAKLLENKRPDPSKVLASELAAESATVEATIPAKNEFRILLTGAKKATDVQVKVTGR